MLALLTWVAWSDGRIAPSEQALLDRLAEAVDDAEELAAIEAAMRDARPKDLELACRYLRKELDRGGKRLLAQLAVTMAIQDGYLTVGENHVLQFLADLLGLSPRAFGKLFEQIAHHRFPRPGDPSSPEWWRLRESGKMVRDPLPLEEMATAQNTPEPDAPMTRAVALRVMGLDDGASGEAVHNAYRRLAKARHPDRFAPLGPAAVAAAGEAFKRLHAAYAVLSV